MHADFIINKYVYIYLIVECSKAPFYNISRLF